MSQQVFRQDFSKKSLTKLKSNFEFYLTVSQVRLDRLDLAVSTMKQAIAKLALVVHRNAKFKALQALLALHRKPKRKSRRKRVN